MNTDINTIKTLYIARPKKQRMRATQIKRLFMLTNSLASPTQPILKMAIINRNQLRKKLSYRKDYILRIPARKRLRKKERTPFQGCTLAIITWVCQRNQEGQPKNVTACAITVPYLKTGGQSIHFVNYLKQRFHRGICSW